MSFLEVRSLRAGYGKIRIVHELSFTLDAGQLLGILGPNGSGKTTLLKSICGIIPSEGECILEGVNLSALSPKALAQRCSYIPQRSGIGLDISALDVVLTGFNPRLGLLEYPNAAMRETAKQALETAGLAGMEEKNYQTMSEGQKQLCILARTMVSDAGLLLLDEPESALDFGGRYRMLRQVRSRMGTRRAAIVTLHDPQLALNCCDELLLMDAGQKTAVLHPASDSLEAMEERLASLYGPLTLTRVKNRDGIWQLVMVK